MRHLLLIISLFFHLLACLPSGHCLAFFSNHKLIENNLLSGFSAAIPAVGFNDVFSLPAGQKVRQNTHITLTLPVTCPGHFSIIFRGFRTAPSAFTVPHGEFTLTNTITTTYKPTGAGPGFDEISDTKHTLTFLLQSLIYSEPLKTTCKAGIFELCKKANDDAGLQSFVPKFSPKFSKFHPEPPLFEKTFNSPSSYNHCE